MISPARFLRFALAALCGVAMCGCSPSGQSRFDEEKLHFLAGRGRVNSMDYNGAIESFTEALQANPHSAAAHFELGWLYEEKDPDAAAAIYHYEQYLKLRPEAGDSETIKQHVFRLKQVLAQAVLPMPSAPALQREFEQLAEDNRKLREELERWKTFAASRAAQTNLPATPTATPAPLTPATGRAVQTASGAPMSASVSRPTPVTAPPTRPAATASLRTHRVQEGESPVGIARKYGVKVDALMAANPGLNPKRLQIGRMLTVPAS